jgi:hypothetical protein
VHVPFLRVVVRRAPEREQRPPVYAREDAPWAAVRNTGHPYGFAAFTVDPAGSRGGITTVRIRYYDAVGNDGQLATFESFTHRRRRND